MLDQTLAAESSHLPSISRRRALTLFLIAVQKVNAQQRSISKVDLFPVFFEFWKRAGTEPSAVAADQFLKTVVQPNSKYYDAFAGTVSMDRTKQYLEQVRTLLPAISVLHRWVSEHFDKCAATFQANLPDYRWQGPVVFVPNLFGFDGGVVSIDHKDVLIFGLDTLAKQGLKPADLPVIIDHELFHTYHASLHSEWNDAQRGRNIPLYWLVWSEGLATWASQQLNPEASISSIFRSAALAPACERDMKELSRSLLTQLDATGKTQFMEWMSGQHRTTPVPPRAGYYFGWHIARTLSKRQSLQNLATWPESEVRSRLAQELRLLST